MARWARAAAPSRIMRGGAGGPRGFGYLYLGPFIIYGDRFAIPPILLPIAHDLNEPLAAVAAVATLYFLLYGVMQLPFGLLSDRFGRVRIMRLSLIGMGVFNAVAALAPNLGALIAAKALAAGFAAAVLPTSLVYVGDKVPFDRRQQVIANVLAAGALGTVAATVASGLLGRFGTWRLVFAIAAVMALALGVLLGRLPESAGAQRGAGPVTQIRRLLSHRWALFLVALAVAEGAAMVGFLTFLAPALEAHGVGAAVAGLVVASYGVAVFAGMQVVKALIRRRSPPAAALIGVGGVLLLAAYLAAAANQGIAGIFAASALIGVGYCFLHSTLQTWATEVAPEVRGTATAMFVTAVFSGAAIGTAGVSGLAGAHRFDLLFFVAALVTVPVAAVAAVGRARFGAAREAESAGGRP